MIKNTYMVMKNKLYYTAPEVERVELAIEQALLDGSITGSRQSYTKESQTWGGDSE